MAKNSHSQPNRIVARFQSVLLIMWVVGFSRSCMKSEVPFRLSYSTVSLIFRRPFQFNLLVRQLLLVGVNSLPVVLVSGIFTGMVLATQGYHQLKDLSAEGSVGRFVSVSVVKELGPMVTAFILAGRIGASNHGRTWYNEGNPSRLTRCRSWQLTP